MPVSLLPPGARVSSMLLTVRSVLPGTYTRMRPFSSAGDCFGGAPALVRLARYWKQRATRPAGRVTALSPFCERKVSGEPSRSFQVEPLKALESSQLLALLVRYC